MGSLCTWRDEAEAITWRHRLVTVERIHGYGSGSERASGLGAVTSAREREDAWEREISTTAGEQEGGGKR